MRHITASIISLLVILPAYADARLPVVNIAAGGVSARAAFGEETAVKTDEKKAVKNNSNNNSTRRVVSRVATSPVKRTDTSIPSSDTGQQIFASSDVLSPRRPSSDLWARSGSDDMVEAPLRLPEPQEFSVFRSDELLPEESIDKNSVASKVVARNSQLNDANVSKRPVVQAEPMSQLDAEIARLTELQRRAEASVSDEVFKANAVIAQAATESKAAESVNVKQDRIAKVRSGMDDEISLSRMIVPVEDDVIVRSVEKAKSPQVVSVRNDMSSMSPTELRKAFRKTFLSENKHLSTYQIDDRFDVASDMGSSMEGFTARRDLSETGGIRPLEIKIKFRNDDAALSRDNYNLLAEYAGIVLSNPTRAVQISIPENATRNSDDRKLAAKRLAIVEQVLRDAGISEYRIMPVLSQREEEGLVLRMISSDQYETLTQQKRDMFGDSVSKKTYKSMSW